METEMGIEMCEVGGDVNDNGNEVGKADRKEGWIANKIDLRRCQHCF